MKMPPVSTRISVLIDGDPEPFEAWSSDFIAENDYDAEVTESVHRLLETRKPQVIAGFVGHFASISLA